MFRNILHIALIGAALIASSSAGRADTIFQLTSDACTGGCGTAPFGTIDLKQTTADIVTVSFSLAANEAFAKTGAGDDTALAFNILGAAPTIAILSNSKPAASDYSVGGSVKLPTYANFEYTILCTGCAKGGKLTNPAGPIDFTVTRASGLSISDFILSTGKPGNTDAYFAADILGNSGNTGIVAALGPEITATPEPTYQLAIFGLAGAAVFFGRRKLVRAA